MLFTYLLSFFLLTSASEVWNPWTIQEEDDFGSYRQIFEAQTPTIDKPYFNKSQYDEQHLDGLEDQGYLVQRKGAGAQDVQVSARGTDEEVDESSEHVNDVNNYEDDDDDGRLKQLLFMFYLFMLFVYCLW